VVAAADQWIKMLVARSIPPGSSVPVISGLLSLTHVQNRGVAFGLLAGISPILMILAAVTLVVLLSYNKGRRTWSRATGVGFALMAGGAAGNLLDRIRFGFVVDYLDVHVWPVFNLADAAIVTGAGLVLLVLMRSGPGADSEVGA
jgi:signal peptidase II